MTVGLSASPVRTLPWDVAIALAVFGATVAVVSRGDLAVSRVLDEAPGTTAYLLVGLASVLLVLRRSHPWLVFVGSTAVLASLGLVPAALGLPLAPGIALYTAAAQRDRPHPSNLGLLTVVAGYGVFGLGAALAVGVVPASELFHAALLWALCWAVGERARLQREQTEELKRSAARAVELAAVEERTRIARDLHDSAGHAINVIAVRAGAARLRHDAEPERSLDALIMIEEVARQTVSELDHLVSVLRTPDLGDGLASPSVKWLDQLVAQHRASGLDVTLYVEGMATPLASPVDHAAYRIVQEGLTNASRHGSGSATVRLDYQPNQLDLEIRNPITTSKVREQQLSRGHGIAGARERAQLVGGTLDIASNDVASLDGEFVLRATLPTTINVAP